MYDTCHFYGVGAKNFLLLHGGTGGFFVLFKLKSVTFVVHPLKTAVTLESNFISNIAGMEALLLLGLVGFACWVIWRASGSFDTASAFLGRKLSEGVKGATINAIGSSLPELFTTLFFLLILRSNDGFASGLGTTAGSALFNILIIPALAVLAVLGAGAIQGRSISVSKKVILRDGIGLLLSDLLILGLVARGVLGWVEGLVLVLAYGLYLAYMFGTMKRDKVAEGYTPPILSHRGWKAWLYLDLDSLMLQDRPLTAGRAWLLLLVAMLLIAAGTGALVEACTLLGEWLGIKVYFLALVVAAAATSLPDTILSVRDARRGNHDDAVSNAFGSNIFDITFALGLPLLLYVMVFEPIAISVQERQELTHLILLLIGVTLLVLWLFLSGKGINRLKSQILLFLYAAFIFYILGMAYEWGWALEIKALFEPLTRLLIR